MVISISEETGSCRQVFRTESPPHSRARPSWEALFLLMLQCQAGTPPGECTRQEKSFPHQGAASALPRSHRRAQVHKQNEKIRKEKNTADIEEKSDKAEGPEARLFRAR